jgi:tetratricopeptide (TPR) repeat protein
MNNESLQTQIALGCSDCGRKEAPSRIPVGRVIAKLDECFATNDMDAAGRLLEYWEAEAVALGDESGELSVVNELLGYYRKIGNSEKGLRAVSRSLELLDALRQGNEVAGATVILNAATTMKAFGKAEEALPLYEKVGAVYTEKLPANDNRFGGFYNNKALALVDAKRYREAEECYRRALAVVENGDVIQPDSAVTYVNMAHLYEVWQPDNEQAITQCLEKAENVLNHPEIQRDSYYAFVCSKCAPSYDYFGFFITAKDLQERAKRIYEGT